MTTDTLLHWLQRTSIEASLLILAVLGLRLMLGTRLSPAWRIGLWMLVGAKLMLPAFIPAGFGAGALWQDSRDTNDKSAISITIEPSAYSVSSVVETQPSLTSAPLPHSSFTLRHSALAAWLLGTLTVLAAALLRQRRFRQHLSTLPVADDPQLTSLISHLSSQARVPTPQIVLTAPGTTPALVGLRQPKILLPSNWQTRFTDRSLRHVLLHELLHIRHRDLLWNWTATAVQALHWFNPLVWFVVSRFQADRELRCDAAALGFLAPSERLDYGHTLLRIQETFFAPPAIAGLAPCVRNHPTLRQRILMIATPTTRQPMIHALLALTLSVLVGYSFTTAYAAEKEVPQKVREGKTNPKAGSEEGGAARKGESDREDGEKKPAMRGEDGEATRKRGPRDSEKPRTGERDGEQPRNKGVRDGEKPRTGERDGEKPRNKGVRDGEKPRTGERDGEGKSKVRKGEGDDTASSGKVITIHVSKDGQTAKVDDKEVAMNDLRAHLANFLPEHPGAKVIVTGDDDTPLKVLHNAVDAVRDNGNRKVSIKTE